MRSLPDIRGHPTSPPIAWVGGKRSILAEILGRFPLEFERYVEVFGGSGVVLFGKQTSPFEVWNDRHGDLYNFYHCVKYRHLELLQELRFLPLASREEFKLLKAFLEGNPFPAAHFTTEQEVAERHFTVPEADELTAILTQRCTMGDVHRAAAFFKLNRLSYGAGMTSFSSQPCDLRRFYGQIYTAHDRLSDVLLENKDFEGILQQYDKPGTFFYLDPPYYMAEDCYAVSFQNEDHHRLYELLHNTQSKWLLSYNDDPFVRELYKNYPQHRFTRLSNLVQRYQGGAEYGELLIANFDMEERGRQHEQLQLFDHSY